ncbi:MAG: hypothetical protein ABIK89_00295 [Planctomycetota bacterium]
MATADTSAEAPALVSVAALPAIVTQMFAEMGVEVEVGFEPVAPVAALSVEKVIGLEKAVCQCGSRSYVDVAIHNGQSTRRDCAVCDKFLGFIKWYGAPVNTVRPPSLPTPCCFCGGRTVHSQPCRELRAGWEPTMSLGKHKGKKVSDVPVSYLKWLVEAGVRVNDGDVREAIEKRIGMRYRPAEEEDPN